MRLLYVLPGEGEPLTLGRLITENGDEVEGVMVTNVLRHEPSASIQFTMLLEEVSELDAASLADAIRSITSISDGLAESPT